jgi:hypothetical protein
LSGVNVTALAAGQSHTLALTSTGAVYAWGSNNVGQLGNGTTTDALSALLVPLPANGSATVVSISAGTADSFALESDGSLWAWGDNHDGQYGNGTTTSSLTPTEVYTPTGGYGISSFAEGAFGYQSLAIVTPIPEPSSLLMLAAAAGIGLGIRRRRWFAGRTFAAPLVVLITAFAAQPARARQVLLVSNYENNTVGEYDATTGATINPTFINSSQGLNYPGAMVLDGNNHLLVANVNSVTNHVGQYDASTGATVNATFINFGVYVPGALAADRNNHLFSTNTFNGYFNGNTVGQYDATTGATINPLFINGQGLFYPSALALDGNNHLFVASLFGNTVGEYDATTGATINATFINGQGLNEPDALALDGLGHILVANANGVNIGEYDATTGATINANFINGVSGEMALDGNNHLFVATFLYNGSTFSGKVGEYDATTGATINPDFINGQGLNGATDLIFVPGVPEPSSVLLLGTVAGIGFGVRRRQWFAGPGCVGER